MLWQLNQTFPIFRPHRGLCLILGIAACCLSSCQVLEVLPEPTYSNDAGMTFVLVFDTTVGTSEGYYMMGATRGEPEGRDVFGGEDEERHAVTLSRMYYIASTEVTQQQWLDVMGSPPPAHFIGANRPVDQATWYEAVEFCNQLSEQEGLTPAYAISHVGDVIQVGWDRSAEGYRLPTEAEWEWAGRGCLTNPYHAFPGGDLTQIECRLDPVLDRIGWYCGNAALAPTVVETHPVGEKRSIYANGLHDMHGNVWEWCWDWIDPYQFEHYRSPLVDPTGPAERRRYGKVVRGGSAVSGAEDCRSAERWQREPDFSEAGTPLGFRPVRYAPLAE